MKIPSNGQWVQTNEGDRLGSLHSTRNITLTTPGKARLSQKSIAVVTPNLPTSNDLAYGLALVYYNSKYTIVHTDGVRTFDLVGGAVGATGTDPTPSIYGDGLIFNSLLLVTTTSNLSSYNGSTWTNSLEASTASVPHPMEIFDSLTTYKLAIGNDNTVKLLDTSYNNSSAVLTLPGQYVVTTLAYTNGYLYVGTRNKNGGSTKIFIWDGNTNNANYEVAVSGNWVYSLKPYKSSVCAILSSGELIYINGNSSEQLAALPVFYAPIVHWQGNLNSDEPRVFHRGMLTDGDDIYINVNALVETALSQDYLPGFESGIWVFNPKTGLNHKASTCYNDVFTSDTGLSISDSTITTSTTHKLKSGDTVVFSTVSGAVTGIDTGIIYYVGVTGTNTIKLANSRRSVDDEEYLTLSGTPTASDKLIYTQNTEYFQYARVSSGVIAKPTAYDSYFKNWSTPIIWAGSVQNSDIAVRQYAINILTDAFNVGTIETQRIPSDNLEQSWKQLYTFLDGLDMEVEEVVVKYRTEEELGYPTSAVLGSWLNTNIINFDREDCSFISVGDEAMILDGYGRGYSAHVTAIDNSSSTTSIELDESVGTANGAVRVSFTNYRKSATHTVDNVEKNYISSLVDVQSPWIQLKLELRGFSTAVNVFDLSNVVHKSTK